MTTVIGPEVSKKNPYYIPRHRYYELKHYCLQYWDWIQRIKELEDTAEYQYPDVVRYVHNSRIEYIDPVYKVTSEIFSLEEKCKKVNQALDTLEPWIRPYILKGVTKGYSFVQLKMLSYIPCEKDAYYTRYRKFFYELSQIV